MPEKETLERAREDREEGKSASTQAGEFVREEMHHVREGKHGARSTKQAIGRRPASASARQGQDEEERRQRLSRGPERLAAPAVRAPGPGGQARAQAGRPSRRLTLGPLAPGPHGRTEKDRQLPFGGGEEGRSDAPQVVRPAD
jgi:hypothetical protein